MSSATKITLDMKLMATGFTKELKKITRNLGVMNKELVKVNRELRKTAKAAAAGQRPAREQIKKTTNAIKKQNLAVRMGRKAFKAGAAALAVYAGTLGVQRLLKFAEAAQTTTNRLRVAQRPGENLAKSFDKISKIAKRTRQPLVELATMYQRITLATKGMNVTQAQAFKITENFGKLLTIQGASAHEARSALTQFTQALQSGKLAGDEFRSISENLPPVLDALVDATQRPRDQLKQLAEEGKLSTDLLLKAMLMASKKINEDFMKTSVTVAQAGNLINTELTILVKAFMDSENGAKGLVNILNGLIFVIKFVGNALGLVLQAVNALVNGFNALIGLGKGVSDFFSSIFGPDESDIELMRKRTEALRAFGVVAQDINDIAAGGPNRMGALGPGTGTEGAGGELTGDEATGDNIRTLTAGFIKRNMKGLTITFRDFKESFSDTIMQTFVHDFPAAVGQSFADMVIEGKSMTKAMGALFKDLAKQVIAALIKMIAQMLIMKAIMMALGVDSFGNLIGGNKTAAGANPIKSFVPGLKGIFKAGGGPVSGGQPYVVGEEGPELFTPSSSGTITPNDEMGAVGGQVVIQQLNIMPNSSIDEALMEKPPSYWLEMAQEKILPALNVLGQGGETTSLEFRGVR